MCAHSTETKITKNSIGKMNQKKIIGSLRCNAIIALLKFLISFDFAVTDFCSVNQLTVPYSQL